MRVMNPTAALSGVMKLRFVTVVLLASTIFVTGAFGKSLDPKLFITDAIKGHLSEIALGELAEAKGGSQAVRAYGKTLAADYLKAKDEASAVAAKLDLTPPAEASAEGQKQQSKLRALSGRAFDIAFLDYIIDDHQEDIQEFEDQVKAANGETSKLAESQLPTLRKHLDVARDIKSEGASQ